MAISRSCLYPLPLDLSATSDTAEHFLLNETLSFCLSDTFYLTGHFCGSPLLAPPLAGLETSVSVASYVDSSVPHPLVLSSRPWHLKQSVQSDGAQKCSSSLTFRSASRLYVARLYLSPRHVSDPCTNWDSWFLTSSSLAPPLVFPISVSATPLPSVVQLENSAENHLR